MERPPPPGGSREVLPLVKRFNEEYVHWDELRRKDIPVDPEIIWGLMRMTRDNQSKHLTIADTTISYFITNRSQRALHLLDTGASGLLVLKEQLREKEMDRYVVSSLMEEAIASSQLEGAVTTTKAAKRMLRDNRKPQTSSEQMIVNDYLTMQKIKEIRMQPLSIAVILDLHRLITHDTLDEPRFEGRFRTDDETVVADPLDDGKVFHQPPSHECIDRYMGDLCKFVNGSSNDEFLHPLVKAILIHFLIGYIHPFVDGNGRLARALMYWYALKKDYWLFEYMAISKVIKQTKTKYGMAYLYTETDENDVTYFINYNLDSMEKALENTRQYLTRKQSEQKAAKKLVEAHPELNFRQAEILKDMIKHKGEMISIREIMTKFNVVNQTARTDLLLLNEMGFLELRKVGPKLYFTYRDH